MKEKINDLLEQISKYQAKSSEEVENFRIKYISRKSVINELFSDFKKKTIEEKKELGVLLNQLKNEAQNKLTHLSKSLKKDAENNNGAIDVTLPPIANTQGAIHPISQIKYKIIELFERIGFNVEEGPEIENDWNNFSALNFPPNHPAREMQDTYFIEENPDILLRTHTSNVQIRLMSMGKLPIRSIMPGRVYRNESISARSHCFFQQIEGLYVNTSVSFVDLKSTLLYFAKQFFGLSTAIRLRPSYFPFTEPSVELDVSCFICEQKGCKVCKDTGWLEIAGAGMVHYNVLKNCNIDPEVYRGFAFGMGIERIAMLKYQIDDLRLFSKNDIRFLRQF